MTDILIALAIGAAAGLIDALPMVKQKVPKFSILCVFAQWVFIGLLVPFVNWEMQSWLKGLIIGELGMVPIMILAFYRNRKSIPSIILFAAILGMAIGVAGAKLI